MASFYKAQHNHENGDGTKKQMIGPRKYDDLASYVREKAEAVGAIVIIFQGKHGHGFSCQLPQEAVSGIPDILRQIAEQIEDGEGKDG